MPADRPFLFLLVDAIPFELANTAWRNGLLPGFGEPRPLVSSFPSLSNVAIAAILGGVFDEVPIGYEARYLDLATGEVRGGFSDHRAEAALEHVHGRPRGFLGYMAPYLLRRPLVYGEIRWITRGFLAQGGPWLAYVPATDGVAHFAGRDGLERAFRDICSAVCRAREDHQRRTGVLPGVVMCSDHGMAFGRFAHLSASELARRLRDTGFSSKLRDGGAVLVPYGDVGGGVVYVDPASAVEVAEVVAGAPGVDAAFVRSGAGCVAIAVREGCVQRARIDWHEDRYRYQMIDGDPLGYGDLCAGLTHDRAADGWIHDHDLRARSWSHTYPDALDRVRHGLVDIVQTPAPVLFSMKETWTYGPALTHLGARLMGGQVGTHGSLGAAESLGFAITTDGDQPQLWAASPALRPAEVLRPWRSLVRAGRADIDVESH